MITIESSRPSHLPPPTEIPVVRDLDLLTSHRLVRALVDRVECGLAAVGPNGELFHANRSARREFERSPALRIERGIVQCWPADRAAWLAALQDAAIRQRSRLLVVGTGDQRTMVVAMPVAADGLDSPAALLMLGRRSVCSPLGLEMLSSAHGLTFAERRVFAALVENRSTREIAELHGVAIATIRSQVRSIREKLQVRSIDALLLRAAEMPPVTATH